MRKSLHRGFAHLRWTERFVLGYLLRLDSPGRGFVQLTIGICTFVHIPERRS
jgi:hypothetical protein